MNMNPQIALAVQCLMIARREPKEHLNGAPGMWWSEYRLCRTEPTCEGEYRMEQRYLHEQDSEYCTCHDGTWRPYYAHRTATDALLQLAGDTGFSKATSLHRLHILANDVACLRSAAFDCQAEVTKLASDASEQEMREAAQDYYVRCLKKRRIYSKATRGEAPEDKVRDARREALQYMGELERERAARVAQLEARTRDLRAQAEAMCREMKTLVRDAAWESVVA